MTKFIKIVQFDLGGMAPPFNVFLKLIPIFAEAGYNMLMLGWEDKFPWKEKSFRAQSALSEADVLTIQKVAVDNGMGFVPSMQVLGHLENFLCIEKYKSLREVPERSDCLNPLANGALEFSLSLVNEVLALSPNIKYLHLGGDEVWSLGQHPDTQAYIKKNSKAKLFLKHMRPIIDMLNHKGIRPLLWHDMMVKWDDEDLLSIKDDIDVVFWGYDGCIQDAQHHCNINNVVRFNRLGFNLWGAAAFKGASGCASVYPDIMELSVNSKSWYQIGLDLNFRGFIVAGWGRYSQFHPPCDPMFGAFDSLFIISQIFEGHIDDAKALSLLKYSLQKHGFAEAFEQVKVMSVEFTDSYKRAWDCVRNLHQQYVMEDKFIKDNASHLANLMLKDFIAEMNILTDLSVKFKKLLNQFSDKNEVDQFVDTKLVALQNLLNQAKK